MHLSVRIFVILNVLFQRKESQDICALMVKHEEITARICGQIFVASSAGFALHRMRLFSLRIGYVTVATGT